MNISFFLTPKQDVIFLSSKATMRQALEKMEYHRYSAVPLVNEDGKYVGTITEGDLLWKIKNTPGYSFTDTNKILLADVPRYLNIKAVHIDAQMDDLISLAVNQNFVPVTDDQGVFIGIVKRSEIIEYCAKLLRQYKD